MKTFQPLHIVKDFTGDPSGDTLIIDPYDDFPEWVASEDYFEVKETVLLRIPAGDQSMWEAFGTIVGIDLNEGQEHVLLQVKINWESAAPLLNETSK